MPIKYRKIAVITASSAAIGQAIALMLSQQGYDMALQYFNNESAAQALKQQVESNGTRVKLLRGDLSEEATAKRMIEETIDAFGRIDLQINTLGPFVCQDILETTPQAWRNDVDLNLNAVFNMVHYAKDYLIQSQGHIINFAYAGVEYLKSREDSGGFCAAKAGLVVLTKSLATRLASFGVRVNMVCPGFIDDSTASYPEEQRQDIIKTIPFARMGRIDEIVEVVRWLVKDSPAYVTSTLIPVSGAWEY
ncbi:MAG: SDR family NAD(P)-dependent oxidoreductase [Pseudomonadota bacterium]